MSKKKDYSKCPKCGCTHLIWNRSITDPFIKCIDCGYYLRKGNPNTTDNPVKTTR